MKYTHRNLDLISSQISDCYGKIQEYLEIRNVVDHAMAGTVKVKVTTTHFDWDGTSNHNSRVKINKYTYLNVLDGLIRAEKDKANKLIEEEVEYRRAMREEENE